MWRWRGTKSGERWRYSYSRGGGGERIGRAGGLEGKGGLDGVKRKCAPLGCHGNQPVDHVVSHAQPRHQTNDAPSVCKGSGRRVGPEETCPVMLRSHRSTWGRPPLRSSSCLLLRSFFLRHAFGKSPRPSAIPLFEQQRFLRHQELAAERRWGPNSSTGKNESKRSLCTKFISCKDFDIYMSSLSIVFLCINVKYMHLPYPPVQPHLILCRIALFFHFWTELFSSITLTLHRVRLLFLLFFFFLLSFWNIERPINYHKRHNSARPEKKRNNNLGWVSVLQYLSTSPANWSK